MSTVRDIIAKLQKYPLDMNCIIEPNIDCMDDESCGQQAVDSYEGNVKPILFRIAQVQKDTFDGNDIYLFDEFEKSESDKQVLVISSTSLKYGEGE